MKRTLFSILLVTLFTSINAQSTEVDITKHLISFYEEYFVSFNKNTVLNYAPQVAESKNKKALLMVDEYLQFLKSTQHFSNEFLEKEKLRLDPCKKDLSKIPFKRYINMEMGEEPSTCNFFYYDYWTNTQDTPDGITVINTAQPTDANAVANFKFYTGKKEDNNLWDMKGQAGFTLMNGEWLISYINFE